MVLRTEVRLFGLLAFVLISLFPSSNAVDPKTPADEVKAAVAALKLAAEGAGSSVKSAKKAVEAAKTKVGDDEDVKSKIETAFTDIGDVETEMGKVNGPAASVNADGNIDSAFSTALQGVMDLVSTAQGKMTKAESSMKVAQSKNTDDKDFVKEVKTADKAVREAKIAVDLLKYAVDVAKEKADTAISGSGVIPSSDAGNPKTVGEAKAAVDALKLAVEGADLAVGSAKKAVDAAQDAAKADPAVNPSMLNAQTAAGNIVTSMNSVTESAKKLNSDGKIDQALSTALQSVMNAVIDAYDKMTAAENSMKTAQSKNTDPNKGFAGQVKTADTEVREAKIAVDLLKYAADVAKEKVDRATSGSGVIRAFPSLVLLLTVSSLLVFKYL